MVAINTNVKALAAQSSMSNVDRSLQTSMQRLSTGLRINNAKDDAAGLAIANRMTSDIRGFSQAIRNANDGLSMAQTADGALGQVTDMLQRMRELAVQAGNGSLNADNRTASQLEIDQLKQQIDNIATQTNFNSINLLDGSAGNIKLQTNVRANQQMTMSIDSAQTKDIGLGSRASLTATGFSGTETIVPEVQTVTVLTAVGGANAGNTSFFGVNTAVANSDSTTAVATKIAANKAAILAGAAAIAAGLTDITSSAAVLTLTYGGLNGRGDVAAVAAQDADATQASYGASVEVTKGSVTGIAKNMAAGDMIINGVQVPATQVASDTLSFYDKASSAISKVAAINSVSAQTGVSASIGNTQLAGSAMVVGAASGTLVINGITTSTIATVADAGLDRAAVVTAINNISSQTGVRAVDTGDINKGVQLVADDGRNISLAYGSTGSLSSLNTGLSGFSVQTVSAPKATGIGTNTGATTAVAGDVLTINGVATAALTGAQTIDSVRDAINLITAKTGVTASVVSSDTNASFGIQLVSTSGNINISTSVGALSKYAINTGNRVSVAQTTTGTYQLGSSNGSPIVVSSTSNGDLRTAGLTAGTYNANTSVATTTDRSVATAAASTTTTGLLQAGTLRINGTSIVAASTADDTSSAGYVAGTTTAITSSAKGASAIAIAAAINKASATTGVTATAAANVVSGTTFSNATVPTGSLFVNGVTIGLSSLTTGYTRGDVATLINNQQGQTGVVATDNGRGLTLTASDGRNISLSFANNDGTNATGTGAMVGIAGSAFGVDTDTTVIGAWAAGLYSGKATAAGGATTYARVTLSSDKSFAVEGGSDGNANFALLGFKTGTFGGVDNGVKVSKIDITSQAGAQVAITALDAALKSVSLNQARLGAFQNRLDQVVSNLTTMNQNMSASRSRVQDADYATETTNLAKSQIISQAATAMLAQANQSGQSVLALLK